MRQLFQGEGLLFGVARFELVLVIAFKDLVIGKDSDFSFEVFKALKKRLNHSLVMYRLFHFLKNGIEAFGLLQGSTTNGVLVSFLVVFVEVGNKAIKLAVKGRLRTLFNQGLLCGFLFGRSDNCCP